MKRLIFRLTIALFLIALPQQAYTCICELTPPHEYYLSAEFIARVQIVSMTWDEENPEYHTAKINILELFKGEKRETFSVYTNVDSFGGCKTWTEPGSEWLIVAYKQNDMVTLRYCSGSEQLLPSGSLITSYDERRLKMYRTLKTKLPNPDFLDPRKTNYNITNGALDKFKGLSMPNETMALYLADFDTQGKVKKLEALHEFKDQSVARDLKTTLEKQLYLIASFDEKENPSSTRQRLVAIYYNPPSHGRPGYFSKLD